MRRVTKEEEEDKFVGRVEAHCWLKRLDIASRGRLLNEVQVLDSGSDGDWREKQFKGTTTPAVVVAPLFSSLSTSSRR